MKRIKSRLQPSQNDPNRSIAEVSRGQYRIDIADKSEDQRKEMIQRLLDDPNITTKEWRFNSKAIWINEEQKHQVLITKLSQ